MATKSKADSKTATGTRATKKPETAVAPLGITEVALRDGHQSLLATRWRTEDMLPFCSALDRVGYWSLECWGGATYDACLRFLGEDPWERLRLFREAMPNSRLQMLLRGQNLLGYRHYADDVVDAFARRSAQTGIDVFRIFDALNDVRNMDRAVRAVKAEGAHAQGTLSYTLSPVHDMPYWVDTAKRIQDLKVDSIAIKDMAGLLHPYTAEELVSSLREVIEVPLHMQSHATTGLSTATAVKAVEAGLANVDTSISSMSMTYGHSPTETMVAIFAGTPKATGLDISLLAPIAEKMSALRARYARFEGSLRGVDARILNAQVPGGMLSNLENQLKQQNAHDRLAEILEEIPKVRKDLGYIPLVTPTSQIVGTQSLINVLSGDRYATLTKEAANILRGAYGTTPAPVDKKLQAKAVEQEGEIVSGRPADSMDAEMDSLKQEFAKVCKENSVELGDEDERERQMLSYALFPEVSTHFLANRGDADAFEPIVPDVKPVGDDTYDVEVEGQVFRVRVGPKGADQPVVLGGQAGASGASGASGSATAAPAAAPAGDSEAVLSPLSCTVAELHAQAGQKLAAGAPILSIEAMKMLTQIQAPRDCTLVSIEVSLGDSVENGGVLARIA